ncbi:MAG: hypothetical protein J0I99_19640 [Devosia sp.]|uniref:AbiU2 domain-containing protein n=1 Tax=Devosia sp. TaxID=1871048 RepID=UPI001ACB531D|nr:hypothetical protein [Devosia sp.]MBN9317959.1 hypothetical protein [Devosia sp.]
MTHISYVDSLKQDQSVLGVRYGAAFFHSRQALWALSSYWDRYEALFGSAERVAVLNANSGQFWHATQQVLFDHVLLGVCRLTDPPQTGKRQNLTLAQLYELDPTSHKVELARLVGRAEKRAEFARSWRNKRIAHNDFDQITGPVNSLAPATRNKVRSAIIGIHDVLRWIHLKHFGGDMFLPELGDDDTNQMMRGLADGNAVREMRLQALRDNDYAAAQLPKYDWAKRSTRDERYSKRIALRVRRRAT